VKAALHEVLYAETREHAREAVAGFAAEYGPKYTKAVTTLEKDVDALFTFFDFPAEVNPTGSLCPKTLLSPCPKSRRARRILATWSTFGSP
jgi:transposase-like protein